MIEGGWEYIWGAYVLTWFVLAGYALSLWKRHKDLSRREKGL